MKTKILIIIALLCLIGFSSCDDGEHTDDPPKPTTNYLETWSFACDINPVTIILSIDSNNMVYVTTNPNNLLFKVDADVENYYYGYFLDSGDRFIISDDVMYTYPLNLKYFDIVKLSNDTMKLTLSDDIAYTCDFVPITEYTFIKNNGE